MKRALISSIEVGRICDVVDQGNEFETHDSFFWVDVPDDTSSADRYDSDTNTVIKFNPVNSPGFATDGYKVARAIAYKGFGDQLDMLFKELQSTGTISNTGPWATHIANVKDSIPKDDPQAVHEWNLAYWASLQANV